MTAASDDDGYWEDEWNREDWEALDAADRAHRNEDSWGGWALKLVAYALALPVVLGLLVLLLILIF